MSLAPGSRLGHCEILAPLGAGGMGEVFRARDTQLHREVALVPKAGTGRDIRIITWLTPEGGGGPRYDDL